eukprot:scaffold21113_cov19-Tisochrysis_lutea.AAC.1
MSSGTQIQDSRGRRLKIRAPGNMCKPSIHKIGLQRINRADPMRKLLTENGPNSELMFRSK